MCPLMNKTFSDPKNVMISSPPTSTEDCEVNLISTMLPPPPKKLSHHFSDMAYFSTESQTSSDISSGVSSSRGSSQQAKNI